MSTPEWDALLQAVEPVRESSREQDWNYRWALAATVIIPFCIGYLISWPAAALAVVAMFCTMIACVAAETRTP